MLLVLPGFSQLKTKKMIKYYMLSGIAVLFYSFSFSQVSTTLQTEDETESTYNESNVSFNMPIDYTKVMIIPFEPKLYMSDIDRDIADVQGLSFYQIRSRMRYGITANVFAESNRTHTAINMLSDDPEISADLSYIYKSAGYQYVVLPPEENAEQQVSKMQTLLGKFKKKKVEEEPGTTIKEGQLHSVQDNQERYMKTKIINPNMLKYLSGKYGTGLFVFINQLNIEKAADVDYRDLEAENYKREIKVHYTIIDWNGNDIYGGAEKYYFSSRINDMNKIIKGMFQTVAQQITSRLPLSADISPIEYCKEDTEVEARTQKKLMEQY